MDIVCGHDLGTYCSTAYWTLLEHEVDNSGVDISSTVYIVGGLGCFFRHHNLWTLDMIPHIMWRHYKLWTLIIYALSGQCRHLNICNVCFGHVCGQDINNKYFCVINVSCGHPNLLTLLGHGHYIMEDVNQEKPPVSNEYEEMLLN